MQMKAIHINDGFLKLFISKRLIQGAAAAILGIFGPIFLYTVFNESFLTVGLFYALWSLMYVVLLVPGMQITNKLGFSHSLILGGIFSVIIYIISFLIDSNNVWYLIGPLSLGVVGYWIFHWVPYHVDFTLFTNDGERGRQVGLTFATVALMGVVGPILAGFIISNAGFDALFGCAVVIMVIATISYAFVPETNTRFEWSLKKTWKKVFSREMRGMVVGEFANGAETIVSIVVWPIFLFEILDGDVFEIGAVSTIVIAATIVIQIFLGRFLDQKKKSKQQALKVGSTLYAMGWIFKIFILSSVQVFFVGLYHNIVKVFTHMPYNAILYDMSAEQGKYVDEFTVLTQMAAHAGRAICLVAVSLLTLFIEIEWTFLIAAVASIALNLVYQVQGGN